MATIGKKQWAGRIASGLVISFLIFDSVIKVLALAPAVEATTQLGYPASVAALIWGGLWLRSARLRQVFSLEARS